MSFQILSTDKLIDYCKENGSQATQFKKGCTIRKREIVWDIDENGCWNCISHKPGTHGYPECRRNYKLYIISHLMYVQYKGEIPKGLFVLHKCDNRKCINPDHLFLGTQKDNIQDMIKKNRGKNGNIKGEEHGNSKLTEDNIRFIRYSSNLSNKELGDMFGVDRLHIASIRRGLYWKHVKREGGDLMKLIAIDDGHGMTTPGKRTPFLPGTKQFMHENEFNRATTAYLKENLERCGFKTLMVAPTDADTPLRQRTDTADNAKVDFYISVHANALTGIWGKQNGIDTFHYPGSVEGKRAAEIIHKYLIQGTPLKDRGVHEANFHVLRETNMPSVLVECGFMDNLKEATLLMSDAYRRECAEEICQGICEYFNVSSLAALDLVTFLNSTTPKIINDTQLWIKKALADKDVFNLMVNIKNYIEKGR